MRITESNSSLAVAMKVLAKIHFASNRVSIRPYVNCREQGLFIYCHGSNWGQERAVSFSENRNSDDIIVQFGVYSDFDEHGVFKSDEKYKTSKAHFDCGKYANAGKFITGWLNGLIRNATTDYRGNPIPVKAKVVA